MKIATPLAEVGDREEILDHIGGCPECSNELRLILDIRKQSEALASQPGRTRENRSLFGSRSRWPGLSPSLVKFAFAFFGAVVTIVSLLLLVQQTPQPDETRSVKDSIGLNAPVGDIQSSVPLLFEWRRLPGADYYVLDLFDEELMPVWTSKELQGIRLLLPADVATRLSVNRPYYWMVTAYSGGEKIAESNLVHFVLRSR